MPSTRLRLRSRRGASTADCRNDRGGVRTEHQLRLREKCFRRVSVQTGTDVCWAHAGVIRFVRPADGGITAKTMWKDKENDRKWWWRRGGGKMGSVSSEWLSASKRSRVSDCSKWQIKGPFMLLHKCSLRTGCETERRVCVRLCSCRGRRLGYRQLCVRGL